MNSIIDYLKSFRGYKVIYYPNPGNAGDSLIAYATMQLFRKADLVVDWYESDTDVDKNCIFLYGGGGNLIKEDSEACRVTASFHARVKKFIILPHTISNNEKLLASFGSNVDVITREMVSFSHVRSCVKEANVYLMDDVVVSLDPSPLLRGPLDFASLFRRGKLNRVAVRRFLKSCFLQRWIFFCGRFQQNKSILNVFRRDAEATDMTVPACNFDLSRIFAYGTRNQEVCTLASKMLLRTINRFTVIRTNRLHVAIAAAVLGKKVEFYANSYYKNEAVYRQSLAGSFPDVKWMEH